MGGNAKLACDWPALNTNGSRPYRSVVEAQPESAGSLPTPPCHDARTTFARAVSVSLCLGSTGLTRLLKLFS